MTVCINKSRGKDRPSAIENFFGTAAAEFFFNGGNSAVMRCQTRSFAQRFAGAVCKPDIFDQKLSSHIYSSVKFNFL
jgi:hypothetical protein